MRAAAVSFRGRALGVCQPPLEIGGCCSSAAAASGAVHHDLCLLNTPALASVCCRDTLLPLVLKSVRSLRSSVCKVGAVMAGHCCPAAGHGWITACTSTFSTLVDRLRLCRYNSDRPLHSPPLRRPSLLAQTAIMAVCDLYEEYGEALLPLTDVGGQAKPLTSLLAQVQWCYMLSAHQGKHCSAPRSRQQATTRDVVDRTGLPVRHRCSPLTHAPNLPYLARQQLLLKCASNDKKFVLEEAQRALHTMVASLAPGDLLPLLLPYAEVHKNPKARGRDAGRQFYWTFDEQRCWQRFGAAWQCGGKQRRACAFCGLEGCTCRRHVMPPLFSLSPLACRSAARLAALWRRRCPAWRLLSWQRLACRACCRPRASWSQVSLAHRFVCARLRSSLCGRTGEQGSGWQGATLAGSPAS